MFYCPDCCKLRETDRCRRCGTKNLRAPAPGDVCFLEEVEYLWAGMLEDVLRQEQIPFLTKSDRPAGISAKYGQQVRFYVVYEQYDRARVLADSLFHAPDENAFDD